MARLDGRGPLGAGPMTGRAMGYCAGEVRERPYRRDARMARRRPGFARGYGRCMAARPYARGYGRYYADEFDYPMDSKESLEEEKRLLEERLNSVEEELNDLNDK